MPEVDVLCRWVVDLLLGNDAAPVARLDCERERAGECESSLGVVGADLPCRYEVLGTSGAVWIAASSSGSDSGSFVVSGARVRWFRLVEDRFLRRAWLECWL